MHYSQEAHRRSTARPRVAQRAQRLTSRVASPTPAPAPGDIVGIEAKVAAIATASDARGLRLLRDRLGGRFKAGIIIYSEEHTLPVADRIWAMPIAGLWR